MGMTHYAVRDGLSFCRIDGRFVFLDVDNDRYFCLTDSMNRALASYLEGNETLDSGMRGLIEGNILVGRPDMATGGLRCIVPATRSAMEVPLSTRKPRPLDVMEILAIVLRTQAALKLSTLKVVLDRLAQPLQAKPLAAEPECRLYDVAAVFRRARLYVPVDMCCLLDSIALATFLRKRQLHAHVVFGVALDPFSAHCWVQAGDLVLNDTVGNVHSHTPIRVV
jgi:hypothetical protein